MVADLVWRALADPTRRELIERMADARRLADDHPGTTLCIDHGGYPGFEGNPRHPVTDFTLWRQAMSEIARAENTVIKISGLGMSDRSWTAESLRPWIHKL